jgi:hypothetical protein
VRSREPNSQEFIVGAEGAPQGLELAESANDWPQFGDPMLLLKTHENCNDRQRRCARVRVLDACSRRAAVGGNEHRRGPFGDFVPRRGKEGKMKIEKTKSGRYQVIIVSGKDEDKKDVKNPDPKQRERKLKGIVIMWNLKFEDGEYVDGYCYNPRDGNTYRVKMKITGKNSLRIRGYLLVPLLGQSQDWVRAS